MSEEEAKAWLAARWPDKMAVLERFVEMLLDEADRQNLISASTRSQIWARHIVDSAQLLAHGKADGEWIDVGSGAGLPGIVVALCRPASVVLIEPRAIRARFLERVKAELGIGNCRVEAKAVERVDRTGSIITARAVAKPDRLLKLTRHLVSRETRYVLPVGKMDADTLATLQSDWRGVFHVEHSVTNADSQVLVIDAVEPR